MSLDVYLTGESENVECNCPVCGHTHTSAIKKEYFSANITHNLARMAEEAGIYGVVWRPEEYGVTTAEELIEPLTIAIALMKSDPARFEALNPRNGWGSYKDFLPWLEGYLSACVKHPLASVSVSR